VANGKTVNISGITLGVRDAGNYTLTTNTAVASANITPAAIANVTGISANNKTYDATTAATLNTGGAGYTGIIGGDSLTVATASGSVQRQERGQRQDREHHRHHIRGCGRGQLHAHHQHRERDGEHQRAAAIHHRRRQGWRDGQSIATFTATYSGFASGEGAGNLTGLLTFTTPATASSVPGSYAITPSGQSSINYAISYIDGAITLTSSGISPPTNSIFTTNESLNAAMERSFSDVANPPGPLRARTYETFEPRRRLSRDQQ
jgi:hypothetical protein